MTDETADSPIPLRAEIWRKALHLVSLAIPVGLLLLGRTTALAVLVPLTSVFVGAEIIRSRSESVRTLIGQAFGFMMRNEELPPVPAPIRFNGATWILLSASIVIALFPLQVAASALVIAIVGDAGAAVVGRKFGRHPVGKSGKTLEGSCAFLALSFPAGLLAYGMAPLAVGLAVIVAAAVEAVGGPVNDNLSVPMAAGIILSLV